MPTTAATAVPTAVYHSHRARFASLPAIGFLSLLLPLLIFWMRVPDAPRTGLVLSLLLGPTGIGFILIGIAYLRLRIETSPQGLRLALPATNSDPWFPWLVKRATIKWHEITRMETDQTPNTHAPHGVERRVVLRTQQGDYHLNSIWFRDFDAIVTAIQTHTGFTITTAPHIQYAGKLQLQEYFVRVWGWTFVATGAVMTIGYGVLSLSGRPETGPFQFIFVLMFWLFIPWIMKLIRYRIPV